MSKSEDNSSIYTPNGADFEYVYWENKTNERPEITIGNGWGVPDINYFIRKLNDDWKTKNIPLKIDLEKENNRIRIIQHNSIKANEINQLHLFPNLAFLLGYTHNITDQGQYLRFDQNNSYLAPHEHKSIMNYADDKLEKVFAAMNINSPHDILPTFNNTFKKLQDKSTEIVLKLVNMMDKKILQLKNEHEEEIKSIRLDDNNKWKNLNEKLVNEIKEENHYDLVKLQITSEDQLNDMRRFYEQRISKIESEYKAQIRENVKRYGEEVNLLEKELELMNECKNLE